MNYDLNVSNIDEEYIKEPFVTNFKHITFDRDKKLLTSFWKLLII